VRASNKIKPDTTWVFSRRSYGPNEKDAVPLTVACDRDGNVVVMFGKELTSFAMTREQAIDVAKLLLRHVGAKMVKVTFYDE
jgi:hypothetical protein